MGGSPSGSGRVPASRPSPVPNPYRPPRRRPRSAWDVLALVVIWLFVLGGLVFVAAIIVFFWGVSQWGSNK
jgi:hypothetical protein